MSRASILSRLATLALLLSGGLFGLAGRLDIPGFWAYLVVFLASMAVMAWSAGPDLLKERMRPGPGGRDHLLRILATPLMLLHYGSAALDVGRFHWADSVPLWLQISGFAGMASGLAVWAWAMRENRFFSSVIRIQRDRGHKVVETGPYRIVRHPGYAAALTLYFWSGLALGSWLALIPSAIMTLLFIRRTVLEDRTLQEELEGYKEYASRVPYRVVPLVW